MDSAIKKKKKETKRYCLRKGNLYVAWDGKTLTEKPQDGIRASRTWAKYYYPDFEMIPFPEAYEQWYKARQEASV
jgi:hypothetical protein